MSSIPEPCLLLSRRDAWTAASTLAVSAGLPLGPALATEFATFDLPAGGPSVGCITTDDNVQTIYKDWGLRDAQPIVFHHGCAER